MPSLLGGELELSESLWFVSLLRKPAGKEPEHAFIMVEGMPERGRVLLRRYDLFPGNGSTRTYEIRMEEENVAESLARKTLIDKLLRGEEVCGKSWQISSDKAVELHQLVTESKNHPDRIHNILGNVASAPKTSPNFKEETIEKYCAPVSGLNAHGIFAPPGHNSFTWSREMLRKLNLQNIKDDLPAKSEEIIASVTSRLLKDASSSSTSKSASTESSCFIL